MFICIFFCEVYTDISGFLSGTSGKQPAYQCRGHKRCGFDPWVRKIPWRRAWQPTPVFLPGEPHGRGTWWDVVHRVTESWTRLKLLSTHAHMRVLVIVNSARMTTVVHVSFQTMVFSVYVSRSGISGSYGHSIFSFLRSSVPCSP